MNRTRPEKQSPENVTTRKTSRLPLIALAALPLTVGVVLAQQTTGSASTSSSAVTAQAQRVPPVQPGQRPAQPGTQTQPTQGTGTNYADVFLQKLAAQLGISVTKLRSAAVAAGSATIDQGVKAGDFPSDRAAAMKQGLQQNPFAIGGGRGGHGGPGMRGPGGPGQGRDGDGDGPGGQTTAPTTTPPAGPSGTTSGTSGT